jgi:hypothetical protein
MPALSTPEAWFAVALGWCLLHVLWQGLFLGIVLALELRAVRNSPATTRYGLCCGALAVLVLCPLLTLVRIQFAAGHSTASALLYVPLVAGKASALSNAGGSTGGSFLSFIRTLQPWLSVVLLIWVLGIGLKAICIVAGLIRLRALPLTSHACNATTVLEMVSRLSETVGGHINVTPHVARNTGRLRRSC